MEASMLLEDDVFFADLSKQISLLIMDDDETLLTHCSSVSLEGFPQVAHPKIHSYASLPSAPPFVYEQMMRRESKGTGVFIPRSSSNPKRKNLKHSKFSKSQFQRPLDNSRPLSISPQNNNFDIINNS